MRIRTAAKLWVVLSTTRFAGEKEPLCLAKKFDIPRQNGFEKLSKLVVSARMNPIYQKLSAATTYQL
jgi:hypothetical protein